jgi:hypothetical protein
VVTCSAALQIRARREQKKERKEKEKDSFSDEHPDGRDGLDETRRGKTGSENLLKEETGPPKYIHVLQQAPGVLSFDLALTN